MSRWRRDTPWSSSCRSESEPRPITLLPGRSSKCWFVASTTMLAPYRARGAPTGGCCCGTGCDGGAGYGDGGAPAYCGPFGGYWPGGGAHCVGGGAYCPGCWPGTTGSDSESCGRRRGGACD